jgi:AcrR family transcriptional regulator
VSRAVYQVTLSIPYNVRMLRSRATLRRALLTLLNRAAFDSITIRDIIREAHVSSATFYRNYETKADVLEDVAAQEMTALIEVAIPVMAAEGTHEEAMALCRYVNCHRELSNALFIGGAACAMRLAFQNHLREGTQRVFRSKIPDDLMISVSASSLIEVLTWWLKDGREFDVETIAGFLHKLVRRAHKMRNPRQYQPPEPIPARWYPPS